MARLIIQSYERNGKVYECVFLSQNAYSLSPEQYSWLNLNLGNRYYHDSASHPYFGWYIDGGNLYITRYGVDMLVEPATWLVLNKPDGMIALVSDEDFQRDFTNTDTTAIAVAKGAEGLNLMLEKQREVERAWGRLPNVEDGSAVSQYIREVVLCATDELHEVLAEVHWKPWKDSVGIKNIHAYREELADVLHFVLDLYLAAGLTGEDIINDYMAKHDVNITRTTDTQYKEQ